MKKATFLLLVLLAAKQVQAQSYPDLKQQHDHLLSSLLQAQSTARYVANKTTYTKERLVAMSDYPVSTHSLADTTVYRYNSTARGSHFDLNNMQYNQYDCVEFNYPVANYLPYPAYRMLINSDTTISYNTLSSSLLLTSRLIFTYDASNNLHTRAYLYSDTGRSGNYYAYSTDASGNILTYLTFMDSLGIIGTDTSDQRLFQYNASNQLVADSTVYKTGGTWKPFAKFLYTYDGSGNLSKVESYYSYSSAGWQLNSTATISYYPDNKLKLVYTDTGASHVAYTKDTFTYQSGIDYFVTSNTYLWSGTSWDTSNFVTKHINAAGLPDTVIRTVKYTGSLYQYFDYYTYDSYNNPVYQYDSLNYGGGSPGFARKYYYYYETYTATDAVPPVVLHSNNVAIYPNPAGNNVTVSMSLAANTKNTLAVIDELGRAIYNTVLNNNNTVIDTHSWSPGLYFFRVSNGNDVSVSRVVKQ